MQAKKGLLNENGYLLFITPVNIFTGNTNKAYTVIVQKKTIMINLYDIQKRFFKGIGQEMCYFLIQNAANNMNNTTITNQHNNTFTTVLRDTFINPVKDWSPNNIELTNTYITANKTGFKRTSLTTQKKTLTTTSTPGKIYEVLEGDATKPDKKHDATSLKGTQEYGLPKYILYRMVPSSIGTIDSTGKYALTTDQMYYYPLQSAEDGEKLRVFFTSEDYKKLVKMTTTGQFLKDTFISHLNIAKILE
jgi:hypothetical protein